MKFQFKCIQNCNNVQQIRTLPKFAALVSPWGRCTQEDADLDTQCQIQHSLLLSIYPLALTVPIVPDGVSSCIISGRHPVNHTEVSSLNEVTGEAVQTLQNSNLIFSVSKSGQAGIKKWIREPEGGIRKKERQDYPVSPSWREQQGEKALS